MVQRRPASFPPHVVLRDVSEADLPILFEHQCDPEACRMAAFPAREWDAFLEHWAKILADEMVPAMAIVVNGDVAGNVVSWPQDEKRLVGYWIGREHWGQGIATQALSQYLRIVTDRPLYAYVAKNNVASIRVLEKCGFAMCPEESSSFEPAGGVDELVYTINSPNDVSNGS